MRPGFTAWVLRQVLGLAPRAFRERYGDEILLTHLERARRGPRRGFAMREISGVLGAALRLRLGVLGPGVLRRTGRRPGADGDGATAGLFRDLRLAGRTLRRAPGFTIVALLVTGLGVGANVAIFAILNAFLLRPLPFADGDRLALLFETNPEFGWTDTEAAPANVLDWREQVAAFQDVATYASFTDELTWLRQGEPVLLTLSQVSGNFFDVLGVPPAVGRVFREEETWADGLTGNPVVISHALWQSHFGGGHDVLGRKLPLANGEEAEVVGVAPAGFSFPADGVDVWSPWAWDRADRTELWFRRAHWVRPVARLAPGAGFREADAELQAVVARLQQAYPETNRVMGAGMMPLRDFLVKDARRTLLVLSGAVLLLLLVAAANVATLVLVRAGGMARELAVRQALGAGRWRVIRQLGAEALLLSVAAAAAGLPLGMLAVRAIGTRTRLGIDGATGVAIDGRVVGFTAGLALVCWGLFTLLPGMRLRRIPPADALRSGGRAGSEARRGARAVRALVVAELAFGVLLVTGAALMARSVGALLRVDPGFQTEGVLAVQLSVPSARYPARDQVLAFQRSLAGGLEARPGVERVGFVQQLPLNGSSWSSQFQARGWPPERVGLDIVHRRADRGYFEALGIPLVRGRLFDATDGPGSELVVLVNERFAAEHFPGEDPIGQLIAYDRTATEASTWRRIVGIVGDQRQESLRTPARAEVFEHREQDWGRTAWLVVRGAPPATALLPSVRAVLEELDPQVALEQVRPLADVRRAALADDTLVLGVLGVFGALALLLATVGTYGVAAQAARRRTRELGIRMAMGARAGQVAAMIMAQGAVTAGMGIALGVAGAAAATRIMASLLFGVSPGDPVTLVFVAGVLAGAALLATLVPAIRAARTEPVSLLRSE